MGELKTYKCVIDESLESDLEVSFVALVGRPAIEKNFVAFENHLRFEINEEKRIISGPAMLADLPIYRKDDTHGEYFVTFDKETIFQIVQKFFKKGFIQNFNLFHDPEKQAGGVTVFESFISDSDRGISPMKGFEDAKDGSWFISAKIDNDEVWEKVKSGEVKGFSVEGIFQYAKPEPEAKPTEEQLMEQLKKLLENF